MYRYGWHPQGDDQAPSARIEQTASFDDAFDGLRQAIADAASDAVEYVDDGRRARRLTRAWSAFGTYLDALADLGDNVQATGPDGVVYWIAKA